MSDILKHLLYMSSRIIKLKILVQKFVIYPGILKIYQEPVIEIYYDYLRNANLDVKFVEYI
jgi:hypothetical protein